MTKFLLIFLGIIFLFYLAARYIKSKIKSFLFNGFDPSKFQSDQNMNNPFTKKNNDKVVFQDGDTVIYKGTAGKKENE